MFKELRTKWKARGQLIKAFNAAEIYKTRKVNGKERKIYPQIHDVEITDESTRYVFTLLNGINPITMKRNEWAFKQVFGEQIEIDGEIKKFVVHVYNDSISPIVKYSYGRIEESIKGMSLPIVVGEDVNGQFIAYDMAEQPHLLISGETGSGKSSLLRAILSTLIQYNDPTDIRLHLGDLKRSEFGIFRRVAHVESVSVKSEDLELKLKKVRKEMQARGDLLDENGLSHVSELTEKPPAIVVCIDEVALLKKEADIMDILEEISAIGRSLNVFLIVSMQRPDSKVLDGKLKNNLTVRISGRQADLINARVAGLPGAEKIPISKKGRMLFKFEKVTEVQTPFISTEDTKKILENYKVEESVTSPEETEEEETKANDNDFGMLGED